VPDRLQHVGRLAGLGDRDDQRVAVQHRVAVAELAGQFHLDGEPRPVLDRVLGHQPGVVGRPAGHHEDLVDGAQFVLAEPLLVQHDAGAVEVPPQGVLHGRRLFQDLLVHEELVAALLGGGQVPVDVEGPEVGGGRFARPERGDLVAGRCDHHHLVLAEFDGLPGVLDEGGHVRGQEHLAVADADHQG